MFPLLVLVDWWLLKRDSVGPQYLYGCGILVFVLQKKGYCLLAGNLSGVHSAPHTMTSHPILNPAVKKIEGWMDGSSQNLIQRNQLIFYFLVILVVLVILGNPLSQLS